MTPDELTDLTTSLRELVTRWNPNAVLVSTLTRESSESGASAYQRGEYGGGLVGEVVAFVAEALTHLCGPRRGRQ